LFAKITAACVAHFLLFAFFTLAFFCEQLHSGSAIQVLDFSGTIQYNFIRGLQNSS
jgi:hypothetical protein